MQMKNTTAGIAIAVSAVLLLPLSLRAVPTEMHKIPVEVWRVGDDGLSQRLQESLEKGFKRSDGFVMSSGKKPKSLVVTIPGNVKWLREGSDIKVLYEVRFTSVDGEILGQSKGSCKDNDLDKCSAHIISDANIAARKIR